MTNTRKNIRAALTGLDVANDNVPYGYYKSKVQPGLLLKCRWATGENTAVKAEAPCPPLRSFITDESWKPATYRKAYAAWEANAPKHDGPIMPRDAVPTSKPRHGKLSTKLRPLMTWKHATQPDDPLASSWLRYDLHADNDNVDEHDEPLPALLDCTHEIQPTPDKMYAEFAPKVWRKKDVEYRHDVAIGGDVGHGTQKAVPEYATSKVEGDTAPVSDRRIVTRIRGLAFSNGAQTEPVFVKVGKQVAYGTARLPAGALVRYKQGNTWRRPSDEFRGAKGEAPAVEITAGVGGHNPGSLPCPDTVVDREWAAVIRKLVDNDTASILDMALQAANFKEIGVAFGKQGKNAERYGKQLVVAACEKLDAILAANDNGYKKAA